MFFDEGSSSKVGDFYSRLAEMKEKDFLRILSFPEIDSLGLHTDERQIVSKMLQNVQQEARRVYDEIAKFRKQHWILYNKYKHGFALIPYVEKTAGNVDFLASTESAILVLHDETSLIKNVITIPHSKKALERYRIVIIGIQTLLKNILENCRNVMGNPNLINLPMPAEVLTTEERSLYEKIIQRFQPVAEVQREHRIDVRSSAKRSDLKWYVDLERFLEESRKRV